MDNNPLTVELAARAVRAETAAFVDLYRAASETWNTAHDEIDGIQVVWNPRDPDPAFSIVLNLSDAPDYDAIIARFEALGRDRAMPRIGINGNPAIERWWQESDGIARSFERGGEEYFWAQRLTKPVTLPELPAGASVELATPDIRNLWGETLNLGHNYDESHARGHVYAAAVGRVDWRHYLIRVAGEAAAASVLFLAGDTGQLFVTATRPEFRDRGFQTYFIARRLHDSWQAGCTMVATQTVTDNASPRNMERRGFQLLYKRSILTNPLT